MIVQRFLEWVETAPSGRRAEATSALARAFLYSDIDEATQSAMEAAMTVLLDDPSPDVRYALADALADSPDAPRHIIVSLAVDVAEIAELVLSRSPVLTEGELVDIAAAAEERLQVSIASLPGVSSALAAALAEVGERAACRALLENRLADIARISVRRMAERFGDDAEMRETMLDRPNLAPEVRQMLLQRLSTALGDFVVDRSWGKEDRVRAVTREACERATVALAAESETEELAALVEHLRVTEQLTTALLLRAVCAGNVAFFEAALSVLARVPEARVASLVRAGRPQSLRAVYDKAGLPAVAFDAFFAGIEACREVTEAGGPRDRYRFTRHMIENVLARYQAITDGEMNELTSMLRRFAADQSRDAARDYVRAANAA